MKKVEVYGTGCKKCKQLTINAQKIVDSMKLDTKVDYINDPVATIKKGIADSPALVIEDKIRCVGRVPSDEEIKNWLSE